MRFRWHMRGDNSPLILLWRGGKMNETAKEIIDSIKIIVDSEIKKSTNIYSGIVDALNSDGTCIVKMGGKQ